MSDAGRWNTGWKLGDLLMQANEANRAGRMKILVVDDQPNLARVTALALRVLGCDTLTAGTVLDAEQHLGATKFDAVFLDVNLGGENGFEFLSQLAARWSRMPIVMFTAHMKDEVVAEATRRGALDCMVKPFDLNDLRQQLARIENFHHQSGLGGSNPNRASS